jgi:hypothetical protein
MKGLLVEKVPPFEHVAVVVGLLESGLHTSIVVVPLPEVTSSIIVGPVYVQPVADPVGGEFVPYRASWLFKLGRLWEPFSARPWAMLGVAPPPPQFTWSVV